MRPSQGIDVGVSAENLCLSILSSIVNGTVMEDRRSIEKVANKLHIQIEKQVIIHTER